MPSKRDIAKAARLASKQRQVTYQHKPENILSGNIPSSEQMRREWPR